MQNELDRKMMVCPLNGKVCFDGRRDDFPKVAGTSTKHVCRWWTHVVGKDPQSEKQVDHFDCAISWLPTLQLEGAQASRQTSASVDKVANQVNCMHGSFIGALPTDARERLLESSPKVEDQ